MQASLSYFASAEDMQRQFEDCRRGILPEDPSFGAQIPTIYDPTMAPEGKHAMSAFAMYFPVEADTAEHGHLKDEMAQRVIAKLTKLAPNFPDILIRHTTFALFHYDRCSACPAATSATASSTPSCSASSGPDAGLDRSAAADRGALPRWRWLPRRPGRHVHPGLQRRLRRPRRVPHPLSGLVEYRQVEPGAQSVYKVIELIGTSKESWEKAAAAAVNRAGESLRDLRVAEVVKLDLQLDAKGKVEAYRAKVNVSFKFED